MELIRHGDTSFKKAKEFFHITEEKAKKMGAEGWIKLIHKNPEIFGITREHVSRCDAIIRKAEAELAKNYNEDNTQKIGRPKSEITNEIFEFINNKLNSDWIPIKQLKLEIKTKFAITDGRVESEYTKYSELHGDSIIREFIKPNGWCIKSKGRISNEETTTSENIITVDKIEEEKPVKEHDPWDD
jgi:hypothetical protein